MQELEALGLDRASTEVTVQYADHNLLQTVRLTDGFVPLNLAGSQTRQVAVLIMVFPQQVRASWSRQSGRAGLVTVTSHPHWVSGQW
jgi:hypothetical protein